ncbi:MAG: response regulator transcription factor [Clostridia bacterium]|nr:response regulator transcription factor [Clostridia bacterium]
MARILVVDDESDIRSLIQRYADREGHEVTTASDGLQAVELCRENDFDIIVMDIMMPEMDGFTACKEIKKSKDIPVLMLSARGEEYDKLFGFEVGVDDYVIKPFSPKELMARVNVIVSRHKKSDVSADETKEIIIDGIRIDTLGRNVYVDGEIIELTAKEYDILLYFVQNQGIALSRDNILNAVWGYDYFGEDRTVDWQIKLLRSKLGNYRTYIKTLRGVGYKFES